jgi:LAO/AO transport system kinase
MDLLADFYAGRIRALSKIISRVENERDGYKDLLARLYGDGGRAVRIGITGPPGAGKSTLVNGLVHQFLAQEKRVGIVAVDPTSPFTGGALLGDRVRMNEFPTDGSVFFRSMATRGHSGGLSGATSNVSVVLDAFGYDVVMIETVGVGQVELDVIDNCDVVVVVLVPESGDAVQTMKAGLMEIAHVFAINKADRPGAEELQYDLRRTLELRRRQEGDWQIPVLQTQAISRGGVEALFDTIGEYLDFSCERGLFQHQRRRQLHKMLLNLLSHRFRSEFMHRVSQEMDFEQLLDEIIARRANPYEVGEQLFARFSS